MDPDPGGIYTTGTQLNKIKYPKKRFSWKSKNKDFLHRKHCDVLLQLLEILKDCRLHGCPDEPHVSKYFGKTASMWPEYCYVALKLRSWLLNALIMTNASKELNGDDLASVGM